ncbi:MAG TPA: hypothetical protein VGL66_12355 [Caulobacteraceae bacterium]
MKIGIFCALAALVAATPALAEGLLCSGEAIGSDRARVSVVFAVDASGAVTSTTADWFPPVKSGGVASALKGAPTIGIGYRGTTLSDIGTPATLSAISVFPFHESTLDGGAFVAMLDGSAARRWSAPPRFDLGGRKSSGSVTTAFGLVAAATSDQGPVNPDLLSALETAKSIRIGFIKNERDVGAATVVEVSAHAARDALLRAAWADASKALQDPSHCVRTD